MIFHLFVFKLQWLQSSKKFVLGGTVRTVLENCPILSGSTFFFTLNHVTFSVTVVVASTPPPTAGNIPVATYDTVLHSLTHSLTTHRVAHTQHWRFIHCEHPDPSSKLSFTILYWGGGDLLSYFATVLGRHTWCGEALSNIITTYHMVDTVIPRLNERGLRWLCHSEYFMQIITVP